LNEEKMKTRRKAGNPREAMNRFRFASEKRRGGTYAHNGEDEQNGHEAEGNEESVDKENREH
jgi:hypothetical protein